MTMRWSIYGVISGQFCRFISVHINPVDYSSMISPTFPFVSE